MVIIIPFKQYLSSFRLNNVFLYTLAIDALTWLLIGGLFSWFGTRLRSKLSLLTGGLSPDAFQQYFLTLSPEQVQLFAGQVKGIVFQLLVFFVVLPIIALLLYSLSSSLLWSVLLNKGFQFKQHWKWNLVNLVMLFLAFGLFLVFVLVQIALKLLIRVPTDAVMSFLMIVGFLLLLFVVHRHFVETRKVFQSVGAGFKALTRKNFYIAWALGAVTIFVLRFVQYPFRNQLFIYPNAALYVGAAIALLWLAWFRMYVVSVVEVQ